MVTVYFLVSILCVSHVALDPFSVMSQPWTFSTEGSVSSFLSTLAASRFASRSLLRMMKELVLCHRKSLANYCG